MDYNKHCEPQLLSNMKKSFGTIKKTIPAIKSNDFRLDLILITQRCLIKISKQAKWHHLIYSMLRKFFNKDNPESPIQNDHKKVTVVFLIFNALLMLN